jgi:hypothetical protein
MLVTRCTHLGLRDGLSPFMTAIVEKSPTARSSAEVFAEVRTRSGRYVHWLFEAKKRVGLSVLNYMVTSNRVHFLVKDISSNVIARSMQLIASRTAQE